MQATWPFIAQQSEKLAPAGFACENNPSALHFAGVCYCKLCKFRAGGYLFSCCWGIWRFFVLWTPDSSDTDPQTLLITEAGRCELWAHTSYSLWNGAVSMCLLCALTFLAAFNMP